MKRKLLVSGLISIGILVAGFGVAYATFTFKANQEGTRQAGAGEAARVTMRVEAGVADANSTLVPDDPALVTNPGGALSFSIENTSDLPIRVTGIALATRTCGNSVCGGITSNKNDNGTYVSLGNAGSGTCAGYANFVAPSNYDNWPTIGPHSLLQVNGTDNNRLGAGMIHLNSTTAQGCQGALFAVALNVTAYHTTQSSDSFVIP